jgi:hypothetical protein
VQQALLCNLSHWCFILQVVFSAVCIATASSIVFQTQPRIPIGILVALCAAGIGLVWSMFRIIVPVFSRKVGK